LDSTVGESADFDVSCDMYGHDSPDLAFEWTPAVTREYRITTNSSDFDTVLAVFDEDCDSELHCDDDSGESVDGMLSGRTSEVVEEFTAYTTYIIVVKGYTSETTGSVMLSITPG
jgi:hypothetical protein